MFKTKILSSLVKVFPGAEAPRQEAPRLTALRNETVSFQVAYTREADWGGFARVEVQSPLAGAIRVRKVSLVPCELPSYHCRDENVLRAEPGLYPDLLEEPHNGQVQFVPRRWQSVWVDVRVTHDTPAGEFPIRVAFIYPQDGVELCAAETTLTVFDAALPELHIPRTEWFYGDCLADYYNVPVFSEAHWEIMERFITLGVRRDINTFLTPQFTPPLDTAIGGERTTIQLVGVNVRNGEYSFDFSNLKRWVEMCNRAGVKWFEMSHLFTQWGAAFAPKVVANVDGCHKRIFGWDTPAVGGEYTKFLQAYLPRLVEKLHEWNIAGRVFFHISDEPSLAQYDSYLAAKNSVAECLHGFKIVDALSNYEFYERGAVEIPVAAIDHVKPFLEHGVKPLWTYYCCGQWNKVSNRFMAMPSARARVYGAQLFKHDIAGALHWGYNYYNSANSIRHINPYRVTDGGCAWPSGDPFLVYPGADGQPEESLRMMNVYHAMTDLRALTLLAKKTSREHVLKILEEGLDTPLTFDEYPKSDEWLLGLRNRVNEELGIKN